MVLSACGGGAGGRDVFRGTVAIRQHLHHRLQRKCQAAHQHCRETAPVAVGVFRRTQSVGSHVNRDGGLHRTRTHLLTRRAPAVCFDNKHTYHCRKSVLLRLAISCRALLCRAACLGHAVAVTPPAQQSFRTALSHQARHHRANSRGIGMCAGNQIVQWRTSLLQQLRPTAETL